MAEIPKILVVDDDPDVVDSLTMILEAGGYQIVTARDGEEALTKIKVEKPNLLLLDLLMPRKDGFAVLKDLQFDEKLIPLRKKMHVVVLTSVREEFARRRYYLETATMELGVDDYLEKPVTPEELLKTVGRYTRATD
ncbi:MAG: two component transcriptional regulator [Dehalococcoidales bacterium]|nr:two component transcriptional regulator [Dehalococcoidales bacterium]